MDSKKLWLACGIITLGAIIIITAVVFAMTRNATAPQTLPSPITTSGTLACLPHKNAASGQPQTLECAMGLRADDGRFYSLQNMSSEDSMTSFESHVTVQGDLYPPAVEDKYDTAGTIKVTQFTKN